MSENKYECDRCQDTGLLNDAFVCPDCDIAGISPQPEQKKCTVCNDDELGKQVCSACMGGNQHKYKEGVYQPEQQVEPIDYDKLEQQLRDNLAGVDLDCPFFLKKDLVKIIEPLLKQHTDTLQSKVDELTLELLNPDKINTISQLTADNKKLVEAMEKIKLESQSKESDYESIYCDHCDTVYTEATNAIAESEKE